MPKIPTPGKCFGRSSPIFEVGPTGPETESRAMMLRVLCFVVAGGNHTVACCNVMTPIIHREDYPLVD